MSALKDAALDLLALVIAAVCLAVYALAWCVNKVTPECPPW